MQMSLLKTVVLVGMMGSGKTSVGKVLSTVLGVPFADTDIEISNDANSTISEIFERDGEMMFR
jgi:shikimate kinase